MTDQTTSISIGDARVSKFLGWAWATIGSLAVLVGLGVYNKLADLNDTLIRAVSQIENQGNQIADIKGQLAEQRKDIESLRVQMYTMEGKTLRGIQESSRGR